MIIYLLIILIIFLIAYIIVQYNSLVKLNNIVKEAFSTMDVYLKKRWDLIPNLVEVVKGYAKYEKETFEQITGIRAGIYDSMTKNKKLNVNEELTKKITLIMSIAENYPNLKANENFLDLSKQLVQLEDEIAKSRKYYNGAVRMFNNKIQMFPSNIFAMLFKFKEQRMFEIDVAEKSNVQLEI